MLLVGFARLAFGRYVGLVVGFSVDCVRHMTIPTPAAVAVDPDNPVVK